MKCLCKYKDIFGKPNEGIHSYRLLDLAIMDIIFTIIAAYLISIVYGNFKCNLIILFILSIILHKIFCVDTTIIKWIKIISGL